MTTDILDKIPYPDSMDEKKKEFLKKAVTGGQNLSKSAMLPYLTGLIKEAQKENLQFSDEEIRFIIGAIKAMSSPTEQEAIDKICKLNPQNLKKQ